MRFAFSSLFAACIALSPADAARAFSGPVLEVVTFRLLPGTTDEGFIALARGTGAALATQPGFVRRSLLRDDSGLWTDLVEWRNLPQAHAAAQAMMADPGFAPFVQAIAMETLQMRHAPVRWQMGD